MDIKAITKVTLIIVAAVFLLEMETAAIVIAAYDTIQNVPIPVQTTSFLGGGIAYAAGILGIHTLRNKNEDSNAS